MPARPLARRAIVLVVVALAVACGSSAPRVVDDPERRCRYTAPAGWAVFDGELRSNDSSLFTLRVFDLREADPTFRDGLPESIRPQLEEWARSYYIVEGEPTRAETTVDGLPTLELTYAVRIRADGPLTKLIYWVVRPPERLFVMRAVFPSEGVERDEPAVREMLATWKFLDPPGASPRADSASSPSALESGTSTRAAAAPPP